MGNIENHHGLSRCPEATLLEGINWAPHGGFGMISLVQDNSEETGV